MIATVGTGIRRWHNRGGVGSIGRTVRPCNFQKRGDVMLRRDLESEVELQRGKNLANYGEGWEWVSKHLSKSQSNRERTFSGVS